MTVKYILAESYIIGINYARKLGLPKTPIIITRAEQLLGLEFREGECEVVYTGNLNGDLLTLLKTRVRKV